MNVRTQRKNSRKKSIFFTWLGLFVASLLYMGNKGHNQVYFLRNKGKNIRWQYEYVNELSDTIMPLIVLCLYKLLLFFFQRLAAKIKFLKLRISL